MTAEDFVAPEDQPIGFDEQRGLYWTGSRWIDPIAFVEQRMAKVVEPWLERTYVEGFKAGMASMQTQEFIDEVARAVRGADRDR